MEDGKLYIVITDKPGEAGVGGTDVLAADTGAKKSKENILRDYAKHRFFNFVESQAKQFVTYQINNIGNFTGDYQTQREVNEGLSILGSLENIGMGAIAGASTGAGPWGAAIGAIIATGAEVGRAAYQNYSQYTDYKKNNYNIDQLRKRSGLNVYIDGSRGTEN